MTTQRKSLEISPEKPPSVAKSEQVPISKESVVIVAATKFFRMEISQERFLGHCSLRDRCRITEDKAKVAEADAVVFHNADFDSMSQQNLPRRADQVYVVANIESPVNSPMRPPNDYINWTMTFRHDSDIWYPYAYFSTPDIAHPALTDEELDKIWSQKTKNNIATWLVSNCDTKNDRKLLVTKLIESGLTVDIWGGCGNPAPACAGVSLQSSECVKWLVQPYKFYISFENTNCPDYVTEKFFETLRSRYAIPIVMQRKLYEDLRGDVKVPPNSFIAVDDFKSPAELIKHLNKVGNSKNLYLSYHQWRKEYYVKFDPMEDTGYCELCRRLLQGNNAQKSYADLGGWYGNKPDFCDNGFVKRWLAGGK
uniref:Fucosyltransferase n=1 Tax=Plectus sambesii TaxID=2011161 RepID=A0A914X6J4_9BILA